MLRLSKESLPPNHHPLHTMKILSLLTTGLLLLVLLVGFTDTPEATAPSPHRTSSDVANWAIDKVHSDIGFKVRHLGISNVRGNFTDYDVTLSFDPDDLSTLETTATVRIASINTENERRDNHLRSPDFFAADEHPEMTFVSKEVRNIDGNEFELVGDLTIRGVTKEVVLDAEYLGTASMGDSERAGFQAETSIDRFDYGLAWDNLTEAGGLVVGREVNIILELEVIKQES